MANYLWGFQNNNNGTSTTTPSIVSLPKLGPASKTASSFSTIGASVPTSQINVARDFYWTYSPVGDVARAEVPRIILTERKLRTNALISQLKYALGQAYSGGAQTINNLSQFTGINETSGLVKLIKNIVNESSQGAASLGQGISSGLQSTETGQQIVQTASKLGAQVIDNISAALSDDNNPTVNSSPWLAPYRNLYLTDPTGWIYVLPYFTNNQATQGNSFADSGNTGSELIQGPLQIASAVTTGLAGILASLNSPAQITYIEKTKFYNYPSEGEDITVEFPLINTGSVTYEDIVRNWQFLFLLLYQNRPGKTSQNTVDQPVIYQVEIPGTKFFPFCYIQSLNIDFLGSRRELKINIPTNTATSSDLGAAGQSISTAIGSTTISTIIPDAYRVTINLKSMIANSKNFMQHMISSHNLVETGTSVAGVTTAGLPATLPGVTPTTLAGQAAANNPFYAAQNPIAAAGLY